MKYVSIAKAFIIQIEGEQNSKAIKNLLEEWHYDIETECEAMPITGKVVYDKNLTFPQEAVELRKGILYECGDFLFIYDENNLIRIFVNEQTFEVSVRKAEQAILFFTVEMLVRYYAPLYDIVFLHAGGFIIDNKVNVLCAFGGVGKTEVTLYAMEHGAQFLADDFAIINNKGEIYPYTKKINLCEYPYTDIMLRRLGKKKWLYNLKTVCERRKGKICSRLASWLETHCFAAYIDYAQVQGYVTPRRFYHIDRFYWADSGDRTTHCDMKPQQFVDKMSLCLDIESRRYFDYDGYLRLKYPFLEKNKNRQHEIINQIANILKVERLIVKGRCFNDLANLVLTLNK